MSIAHHRKSNRSYCFGLLTFFFFTLTVACLSTPAQAQASQKVVQGKVVGSNDEVQPGAIVYLKNSKTNDIKSFISTQDGSYRFGQLSPDVDYEVWAEYQGKKSSTKTVSSFDSKKLLIYSLKLGG
ncbi:hypothetical protein ACPOL_0173 [Acidisarcina polymorpha]|uniref:Carboxypeptidase regulatory-like domain-containing protein n=1 Tax=Acidisarcina polymorpha TaxID=2211140 RepID=A0A2Z5FS32_9BACT|nr:carboxypeptidase-like regulatory domain-containing protein [Acidisarcina polymorpha]AXC09558.1 hypothetical protein ACPOL_0173 [Acidisarcina polymorpha]